MSTELRLFGLDGCKHNAWVVAESDSKIRQVRFRVEHDLTRMLAEAAEGRAILVLDVPIGLDHDRACDREARALLRHRHVCVFTPPCREALAATSYEDAKAINRLHCGKAISKQAFSIRERISAVDDCMNPELQSRVKEGHPEVAFAALNGGHPLEHNKKKPEGVSERLRLLEAAGLPLELAAVRAIRDSLGRAQVGVDDVVDAAVMLVSARDVAAATATWLPGHEERRDSRGLVMEMWMPKARSARVVAGG